MLSRGVILYGAVVAAIALAVLLGRERRPAILVTIRGRDPGRPDRLERDPARHRRRFFTYAPALAADSMQPWLQYCYTAGRFNGSWRGEKRRRCRRSGLKESVRSSDAPG